MISVTIREALGFRPALVNVMQAKLPAKAAYRLSRIAAKLSPELEEYEKQRYELFKQFGTESEDKPGAYEVKGEESLKALQDALEPLLDEQVKIDVEPLAADMLGDAELTAADLLMLEKVIA
jgi:hypothetical protein